MIVENNNQKDSLRIVEWNISKLSPKNTVKQNKIIQHIHEVKPDILILTECGASFKCDNFKRLLDNNSSNWKIFFSKENNFNYIAILVNVNNKKFQTVERLDFQKDFCEGNKESQIHPDRVAVKITLNNNTITVLGIRLLTSFKGDEKNNLHIPEQQILQNIQLVHDIQALEPDIIIGDFNTFSEMENPGFYDVFPKFNPKIDQNLQDEWKTLLKSAGFAESSTLDVFCQCISGSTSKYKYWAGGGNSFSVNAKNSSAGTSATAPDTLIWRSEPSEDDNDKPNPRYYPKPVQEKTLTEVMADLHWPSDHCMLIADIEIPSEQHLAEDS